MGKLIRDNIAEIAARKGETLQTTTLNDLEFIQALKEKLKEETTEVNHAIDTGNPHDILNELADVLEVLITIANLHNFNYEAITTAADVKRDTRGAFKNKTYLQTTP